MDAARKQLKHAPESTHVPGGQRTGSLPGQATRGTPFTEIDRALLDAGYLRGFPPRRTGRSTDGEAIDLEVCAASQCGHCGYHGLTCRPYFRANAPGAHSTISYRAFAHCPACGLADEFSRFCYRSRLVRCPWSAQDRMRSTRPYLTSQCQAPAPTGGPPCSPPPRPSPSATTQPAHPASAPTGSPIWSPIPTGVTPTPVAAAVSSWPGRPRTIPGRSALQPGSCAGNRAASTGSPLPDSGIGTSAALPGRPPRRVHAHGRGRPVARGTRQMVPQRVATPRSLPPVSIVEHAPTRGPFTLEGIMVAHPTYQGPTRLLDQSAWDRALARAHGQQVHPICVQHHLWLCRSSDGRHLYQIRQQSARARDLMCSCPTDEQLVCKHMAAVAQAVEDLDRLADLHHLVRAYALTGDPACQAQAELALVEHRIAQRHTWFAEEQDAVRDLLDTIDGMDPALFADTYRLDAQTQYMLDQILGAEQIELTEDEIALLAAQHEEDQPLVRDEQDWIHLTDSSSDSLDEALRQQLEDSLNEPDALYLAFADPW